MNIPRQAAVSFGAALGRWAGTAEVYSGDGRFLGNAADTRHFQTQTEPGRLRNDVSFIGPLKFASHYHIQEGEGYRLYQGPANYGYAEVLSKKLVDANAYWPELGFSQRFFLMLLDEDRQISLGLMSRGEQLIYVVVGEYHKVSEADGPLVPALVTGSSYDLADDPAAGRGVLLLHRAGQWSGQLAALDGQRRPIGASLYREHVTPLAEGRLQVQIEGSHFDPGPRQYELATNQRQAWTAAVGAPVMGSYSLSGGRALSGQFHHLDQQLRVWRREVAAHDGAHKVVIHYWYRGGERIGIQFGVLKFDEAAA
jgi:hypothetical protein